MHRTKLIARIQPFYSPYLRVGLPRRPFTHASVLSPNEMPSLCSRQRSTDIFPDVCAPHTLLISSQSSYGASSLYPQPHSDAVQNSRSYVRLECRWNDQHADVTPISVSRSSIWPADFYDAEKCTKDEKFIQQKMKRCDKRTQTIFYNTNICIWQWYWIITLKNITRVSFRKKKEVCEGCEETTAVLLPSHIKANICLQFCAIRNVLKYAAVSFDFISEVSEVQFCLCYCWTNTEANTANARSLTRATCMLSLRTNTNTFTPNSHSKEWPSVHPNHVTEWAGSGVGGDEL